MSFSRTPNCLTDITMLKDQNLFHPTQGIKKLFTVSEITKKIRHSLEYEYPYVGIVGEISNVRIPSSGHVYLTLKDKAAQLQAVIFRNCANKIKFKLKDGMEIISFGSLTVYEPRGQYQLIIDNLEPKGLGALQLAFQQLKEKLEKEGLFDPSQKRQLPFMPKKIGIITSPTGAAIKDILNIIDRRFAKVEVLIYPVKVQGEGAAEEISRAISYMNTLPDIDVIIVGRGGGSLEDLWAFNEEVVARSIFNATIPIISAVGHEIDVTISDLVADRRALTPSEAGELVVPRRDLLIEVIDKCKMRLFQNLTNKLKVSRDNLARVLNSYTFQQPSIRFQRLQQRLDDLVDRLNLLTTHSVSLEWKKLLSISAKLESLNPLHVLKRGYTVTTNITSNQPITEINSFKRGDKIKTRFSRGSVVSEVLSSTLNDG